jgi:hypothetical protein
MAEALQWVSRITTVALMMLLPIVGGRKLDEMRETKYWGTVGLVLGLALGAWQLRQIVLDLQRTQSQARRPKEGIREKGESAVSEPKLRPPEPESKIPSPPSTTETDENETGSA